MDMFTVLTKVLEFFKSIKTRTVDNKNTTIGGGVAGVAFAALIGKLEEMSGCHFAIAFANVDYLQLAVYVYSQVAGALTTDASKTISVVAPVK